MPHRPAAPHGLLWLPSSPPGQLTGAPHDRWFEILLEESLRRGCQGAYVLGPPEDLAVLPDRIASAARICPRGTELVLRLSHRSGGATLGPARAPSPTYLLGALTPLIDRELRVSLEWDARLLALDAPGPTPEPVRAARELVGDLPWGIFFHEPPSSDLFRKALAAGPTFVRMDYHLLSPAGVRARVDQCASAGVPVLASDPFAHGRLDGSRLRSSLLDSPTPVADLPSLRQEWAPVLALGFLTAGHRRTLAGAALAFLRDAPGVAGIVLGAGSREELQLRVQANAAPPLTAEERAALLDRPSSREPGGEPRQQIAPGEYSEHARSGRPGPGV